MGKRPEQTLLQGGHTEGPETYENMLYITSHQKDVKKKKNPQQDIISYLPKWPSLINQQTTSAGEDVEKREP